MPMGVTIRRVFTMRANTNSNKPWKGNGHEAAQKGQETLNDRLGKGMCKRPKTLWSANVCVDK